MSSAHHRDDRCLGAAVVARHLPPAEPATDNGKAEWDWSRRLLRASARQHRYVHVGGHEADPERSDRWKALRGLLGYGHRCWACRSIKQRGV
jgi:hypothetical protein